MDLERLEKLERSVSDLTSFVRMWLVTILIVEVIALSMLVFAVLKIGEFWVIETRLIYQRIERIERSNEQTR